MPPWLSSLLGIIPFKEIIQAILTFAAAYYAARVAFRRFQSERLWEKRFAAYNSIIDALHQMYSAFSDELDEQQRASRLDEAPKPSHLEDRYQSANNEILRAIGVGEFIISAGAVAELRRLQRELNRDHVSYIDYVIDSMQAANNCLGRMRHIARADLNGGISVSLQHVGRIAAKAKRALMSK